ncbi:MAG: sulfite exporter TauE/SafE family protein [Bacteroidetes bacterium]|nr:sulfite exporter TauE/SafE family protein [Bacteroidota bacterium]
METIIGMGLALVMGVVLGLIGGGGSILTMPILVYLLGFTPVDATAHSLFIVGLTSLAGSFTYLRRKLVNMKTAVVFAVPSCLAVFLTRKYLMPVIPEQLFEIGGFMITKDLFIMCLFALLMLACAFSMIYKPFVKSDKKVGLRFNYPLIFFEGFVVGVLTGILGAGGGFLIVPALVLLVNLPMKLAVGTSLLIISTKSLIGFLGDLGGPIQINWHLAIIFSIFAIVGILIGSHFCKYVPEQKLKSAFGWFVLVGGIFIFIKELIIS